jgi:hypothetical protein
LPKPPTEGNGASALLAAADELMALKTNWPLAEAGVSPKRMTAPGKAQVVYGQDRFSDPSAACRGAQPTDRDWSELAAEVEKASPILERVREALRQPVLAVEVDHSQWPKTQLPHLSNTRLLARWLNSMATLELHNANLPGAVENITGVLGVAQLTANDRLLVSEFCRLAILGIAADATWAALQSPACNQTKLTQLQQAWEAVSVLPGMANAIETERLMHLQCYQTVLAWPAWNQMRREMLSFLHWGSGDREPLFDATVSAYALLWRLAWVHQDQWRYLRESQFSLDRARRALGHDWKSQRFDDDHQEVPIRNWYDTGRYFLSGSCQPRLSGEACHALRYETGRQMVLAAIALKRHELRHGQLPAELTAIVPEFLPDVPRDYMDGQPLRYRLNADKTFTLYSVGEDGVDDGGDPTPRQSPKASWMWEGRDAV